jgi:hypothetical protein
VTALEATAPVAVAVPGAIAEGTFARHGAATSERLAWFVDGLSRVMTQKGYEERAAPGPEVQVVLHMPPIDDARYFRRKSAPVFVVVIVELPEPPSNILRDGYPLLARCVGNLAVLLSDGPRGPAAHFVTLEQGTYTLDHAGDNDVFFRGVFERVEPLATSRLVIGNEFVPDLPLELRDGDKQTRQITRAGERLGALDLLPTMFPLEDVLTPRDMRHVKLLFGVGGFSYGNVSARRLPPTDSGLGPEFWMSASGVDKSRLVTVGRDMLLVRGYDADHDAMVLSVPADVQPNRVSVDAIEHWMIYREHPDVGAILHVHAWVDGVDATTVNFPCGTAELAESVAELVREAPDPSHAIIGLKNHGLTITGSDLDEIFERVEPHIQRHVPMS